MAFVYNRVLTSATSGGLRRGCRYFAGCWGRGALPDFHELVNVAAVREGVGSLQAIIIPTSAPTRQCCQLCAGQHQEPHFYSILVSSMWKISVARAGMPQAGKPAAAKPAQKGGSSVVAADPCQPLSAQGRTPDGADAPSSP